METNLLKVPGAKCSSHPTRLKVVHQAEQTGLRLLVNHGTPLNGLDFGNSSLAVFWRGQLANMMENVDRPVNSECFST